MPSSNVTGITMRLIFFLLLMGILFSGCSVEPTPLPPQPTTTPTIATKTPVPSVTFTPLSSQTTKPISTIVPKIPTANPTTINTPPDEFPLLPVSTRTLSDEGPWGFIPAKNGLWVMNADGSGVTRVYEGSSIVQLAVSPIGRKAAFITHTPPIENDWNSGFSLQVITTPDFKVQSITSLDLKNTNEMPFEQFQYNAQEAARALRLESSITWSPDGRYLAFISSHEGSSMDVYVYIVSTGEIRRLTDGTSQAYGLSWSPDSRYIFHAGADNFGTGAGASVDGAWVVSVDGKEVIQVLSKGSGHAGDASLMGWVTNDIILIYTWNIVCGDDNLREIHFLSGTERILWPGCLGSFVYDQEKNEVVITNHFGFPVTADDDLMKEGTFLVVPGQDGYRKLSDKGYEILFDGNGKTAWYGFVRNEGLYALEHDGQVLASFSENIYNHYPPGAYLPDADLFLLENWITDEIDLVEPGKGKMGTLTTPYYPTALTHSPTDSNLIFITSDHLYAMRIGEWINYSVSQHIENSQAIYWVP